jgi:tetratricopeptide (TPR) repeat protein
MAHARRGIDLLRKIDDRASLARALVLQGRVSMHVLGDSAAAELHYSEAIAIQKAGGALVLPQSLAGLGQVRWLQGRGAESLALIDEGLELAERFADPWSVLACLNARSLAQRSVGDYAGAEASARRALALCRQFGQARGEVWAQMLLGDALKEQDRLDEARQLYELCASRAQNDGVILHGAQLELGNLALLHGQGATADALFGAALAGYEAMGTSWGTLLSLDGLARSACAARRCDEALQLLRRAYAIGSRARSTVLNLQVVATYALVAAQSGRQVRAVELLALADHHPATELATRIKRIRPLLAELSTALSAADFAAAQARGQAQDLAELHLDEETLA